MLKVVVFDSGWGGDIVAQDVEDRLAIIDVIRVIDWRHAPYAGKSRRQICSLTESALRSYIGCVDVIIIASFEAQCAVRYLKTRFPYQKFIAVSWPPIGFQGNAQHTVMVLTGEKIKHSLEYLLWRRKLRHKRVIEPVCEHWTAMIDNGKLSRRDLQRELAPYRAEKVDTIILGNTHFWDLQEQIEGALGWQATVIDPRQILVNQVCVALELDGANYLKRW